MALPEKPQKILTVLYQDYLQHGYTLHKISYDSFDCPKSELSGPLDTLKEYGYLDSYTKRRDGLLYSITAKGIDFCSEPAVLKASIPINDTKVVDSCNEHAVSKASIPINDTNLTDLQKDLLKDFLSNIDNQELSEKSKKAKIKGQLSILMSSMSTETFTDILSDVLCR